MESDLIGKLQREAYKVIYGHGPVTGQEITVTHGIPGGWKRCSELEAVGMVYAAVEKNCSVTGQLAIGWDVTDRLPPATQEEKQDRIQRCLDPLRRKVAKCQKCPHLVSTRRQTVFGEGDPRAELAFVGEAPGEDEDRQGRPFVGRAGKLLTQVINRLGFYRRQVYICNVLKCRPDAASGNRKPTRAEMLECLPYLKAQLGQVRPKVIVILGGTALEAMLEPEESISRLRGEVLDWQGTPAIPTWHPAYVLRNPTPQVRREFWSDCLEAVRLLGYVVRKDDALWLPRVNA